MRRSLLGIGLAFVIASVVPACFDTDSLSGGEQDASTSDASQNSDSSFADVIVNDASPADGGSSTKGCDAQICDNFDLSTTLGSVWMPQAAGGTVTIAPKGLSLPNALETHVPTSAIDTNDAFIEHVFASAANAPSFHLELDMFLSSNAATSTEKDLLVVEGDDVDPASYSLYIGSFSGAWKLAEYTSFADGGILDHSQNLASPPPMGAWTHVVLTCDGSTMVVSFDGTVTATLSNLSPLALRSGIQRKLQIGWTYTEKPPADLDVLFDNIAFSFGP